MIKTVLFDLDHTLLDRAATIKNHFVGRPLSYFPFREDLSEEEIISKIIELENPYIFWGLDKVVEQLKLSGYIKKEYIDMPYNEYFDTFMREPIKAPVVAYPYASKSILELKKMGLRVSLLTDGEEELQMPKIKSSGLKDLFDDVFISDSLGIRKPDHRLYELACEKMGVNCDETAYVGDNPLKDMVGAAKAGLIPIWVHIYDNWPQEADMEKPKLSVKDVSEVPELIRKYNKK